MRVYQFRHVGTDAAITYFTAYYIASRVLVAK